MFLPVSVQCVHALRVHLGQWHFAWLKFSDSSGFEWTSSSPPMLGDVDTLSECSPKVSVDRRIFPVKRCLSVDRCSVTGLLQRW